MSTAPRIAPSSLVLAENVRKTVHLSDSFKVSIATRGVRTPVLVRTDDLGNLAVIDGQRRVLAALDAGLTEIPYIVLDDVEEGAGRIVEQLDANQHRDAMTTADVADAYEQLRLFGLSAADIAKKTARPKREVEAALTLAVAPQRQALLATDFDLVTTAAIADVAGEDADLAAELVEEVERRGVEQVEHILQAARDDLAVKAEIAARTAEYTAAGVTVLDARPYYDDRTTVELRELVDETGQPIAALNHEDCPGRAVHIRAAWRASERLVDVDEYCTQWKTHHRKRSMAGKPAVSAEEASEERKHVIASNKASDAALSVRRKYMKDLLTAGKLPATAIEHAATMIARHGTELTYSQAGVDGDPLTAIWPTDKRTILTRDTVSKTDATRALLAHAFAVGEADLPRDFWRKSPTRYNYGSGSGVGAKEPTAGARHLKALAAFGYPLSDVEQTWLDSVES